MFYRVKNIDKNKKNNKIKQNSTQLNQDSSFIHFLYCVIPNS